MALVVSDLLEAAAFDQASDPGQVGLLVVVASDRASEPDQVAPKDAVASDRASEPGHPSSGVRTLEVVAELLEVVAFAQASGPALEAFELLEAAAFDRALADWIG